MKPPADQFTVFVVCDDPGHSKTQAVTNFVRIEPDEEQHRRPGHHWDELYPGKRKSGADSAVTLVDKRQPGMDHLEFNREEEREYWSRARSVYELECRKCRKPYQFRMEKLFPVLEQLRAEYTRVHGGIGVLPISLQAIASRIDSLSRTSGD